MTYSIKRSIYAYGIRKASYIYKGIIERYAVISLM